MRHAHEARRHEASIKSGALWQVLFFIGLLEIPSLLKLANGSVDAISGMTHHYFLTGKGPIEFITQIPNFKSCAAAAVSAQLCR